VVKRENQAVFFAQRGRLGLAIETGRGNPPGGGRRLQPHEMIRQFVGVRSLCRKVLLQFGAAGFDGGKKPVGHGAGPYVVDEFVHHALPAGMVHPRGDAVISDEAIKLREGYPAGECFFFSIHKLS